MVEERRYFGEIDLNSPTAGQKESALMDFGFKLVANPKVVAACGSNAIVTYNVTGAFAEYPPWPSDGTPGEMPSDTTESVGTHWRPSILVAGSDGMLLVETVFRLEQGRDGTDPLPEWVPYSVRATPLTSAAEPIIDVQGVSPHGLRYVGRL